MSRAATHIAQRPVGGLPIKPAGVAVDGTVFPAVPAVEGVVLLEGAHMRSGDEIMEAMTRDVSDFEPSATRFEDLPQVT